MGREHRGSSPRRTSWRPPESARLVNLSFSFVLFLITFLSALHISLGQAWTEGEGVPATCRHCADSGQELDCT